jgi:glycosyltransferase involved in cell wall biosynthesis
MLSIEMANHLAGANEIAILGNSSEEIAKIKVSILIPLFNEGKSINELYLGITKVLRKHNFNYEIIFVDDGSTDDSFEIIRSLQYKDSNVRAIRFRRNFGKSMALDQGFRKTRGEIVITMDADLQDDPKEIPRFIAKVEEGFDLVSGWKESRKDSVLTKNLPSKLFNFVVRTVSGAKLHDFNCGFKAYRRHFVKSLTLYGDLHRFIPALAFAQGYKVAEISVRHHARPHGKSKFGLERFSRGFFDFLTVTFLTKFLKRPMHFFGWLGGLFFLGGFVSCFYLTVLWWFGEAIGHRPLLILGVLLILVGVQMVSTGLIAEMITYGRQKREQEDFVEEILGWNEL